MPQLKNSQQRWLCALVISWILFLACNWVLNLWKLQPLLSFRSGREKAALTRDDVVEILMRAGGIRALSKNEGAPASRSNGGLSTPDPFATLLAKVGITATFVPENSPTRCIIKWYPQSERPQQAAADEQTAGNDGDDRDTSSAEPDHASAPAESQALLAFWDRNTEDSTAFNLVLESDGDTVTYSFEYGDVRTEARTLLARRSWRVLPIRPVNVESDLVQVVAEFIEHIPLLYDSQTWRQTVFHGQLQHPTDRVLPTADDAKIIGRAVEGVLIQVFATQNPGERVVDPARPLPRLQDKTLLCRVLNGSNQLGWIQFVIAVVFVRGILGVIASRQGRSAAAVVAFEVQLIETVVETLPAIGFLGTLLGMAVAFSAGLDDRNNLTQSLTLAISTSALALVGALSIVWMKRGE
ncbi:MAG: MotA/TolQ/ExbB proton channel family protein [Rhodopirellula sp.]|nr:MotA/TolQ/ExbB proton channel family protein [Rhodopirellula sp.]